MLFAVVLVQVDRSSLVLDPYVGTGSILIAAAARGAHTMGCDIDVRVLKHGRKCPKTGKQVGRCRQGAKQGDIKH
jgi:tRNA (guanine10-N2)-methyltransferase